MLAPFAVLSFVLNTMKNVLCTTNLTTDGTLSLFMLWNSPILNEVNWQLLKNLRDHTHSFHNFVRFKIRDEYTMVRPPMSSVAQLKNADNVNITNIPTFPDIGSLSKHTMNEYSKDIITSTPPNSILGHIHAWKHSLQRITITCIRL